MIFTKLMLGLTMALVLFFIVVLIVAIIRENETK